MKDEAGMLRARRHALELVIDQFPKARPRV
jgi:hypothetical protein